MSMDVHPANAAAADRTIAISATDQLSFTPNAVTVRADETVAFKVTNTGKIEHEFVLGDAAAQQQHEAEMAQGGQMDKMAVGSAVEVPPGKTATLVYTFGKPGTLLFGCHVPGHYAAGMQGTVTVTQS